jgi:hypothetical protein
MAIQLLNNQHVVSNYDVQSQQMLLLRVRLRKPGTFAQAPETQVKREHFWPRSSGLQRRGYHPPPRALLLQLMDCLHDSIIELVSTVR